MSRGQRQAAASPAPTILVLRGCDRIQSVILEKSTAWTHAMILCAEKSILNNAAAVRTSRRAMIAKRAGPARMPALLPTLYDMACASNNVARNRRIDMLLVGLIRIIIFAIVLVTTNLLTELIRTFADVVQGRTGDVLTEFLNTVGKTSLNSCAPRPTCSRA